LSPESHCFGLAQDGQQECRQNPNDGEDNQKFDERKARPISWDGLSVHFIGLKGFLARASQEIRAKSKPTSINKRPIERQPRRRRFGQIVAPGWPKSSNEIVPVSDTRLAFGLEFDLGAGESKWNDCLDPKLIEILGELPGRSR